MRNGRSGARSGARAERAAEAHLCGAPGFRVLARNWRAPRDRRLEIDLVCLDGPALVFVEVKARAAAALVPGYESLDGRKRAALRRAAAAYLAACPSPPPTYRLDVVEVDLDGETVCGLRHYEAVPLFGRGRRR